MPLCCRLVVNRFYQMVTNVFFSFTFKNSNPNPFFEDTKLTKTFTFSDEGITKISATSIKWKEGIVRFFYPCTFRFVHTHAPFE